MHRNCEETDRFTKAILPKQILFSSSAKMVFRARLQLECPFFGTVLVRCVKVSVGPWKVAINGSKYTLP